MMQQPEKMMHAPSPNYYILRKSSSHEKPNHLIIKTCALSIIRVAHVDIGSVNKARLLRYTCSSGIY